MIVAEVKVNKKEIKIITGYGPQENWDLEKRMLFFTAIETKIVKAKLDGKSAIIEMDANSKVGKEYITNDPHEPSPNRTVLIEIIECHNLKVGNGSDKCKRTITRKRVTKKIIEESVIDIVLFTEDLSDDFEQMVIDEVRNYVLTSLRNTQKGTTTKRK